MEIKETFPADLEKRELATILKVRNTFMEYGTRLRKAQNEVNMKDLYNMVEEVGYSVNWVDQGFKYLDATNTPQEVTKKNPVRIGANKQLYVAVIEDQVDVHNLVHDIGACLLGIKEKNNKSVPIRLSTLNKVVLNSLKTTLTPEELLEKGLITEEQFQKKEFVISPTYLFDSLVDGDLDFKAVKYPLL